MTKKYHIKEFKSFKELNNYMNKIGCAPSIHYVTPSTRIKTIFEGEEIVEAPKPKPAPLPPKRVKAKRVAEKKVEVKEEAEKPKSPAKKKRKKKVSKKDA